MLISIHAFVCMNELTNLISYIRCIEKYMQESNVLISLTRINMRKVVRNATLGPKVSFATNCSSFISILQSALSKLWFLVQDVQVTCSEVGDVSLLDLEI